MKWSSLLVLSTLAFLVNACEKHPASELPLEHATAFGEHAWPPKPGATAHGEGHTPAAAPHAPAPTAESPAGEAPKFFPEKK